MDRILLTIMLLLFSLNIAAKKAKKLKLDFKHSQFSVQIKKKKLILSCNPLKKNDAQHFYWINECNNIAFNLLSQEKYQNILVEKYVEDEPFGKHLYQTVKQGSNTISRKKTIRKSFKIISK